MNSTIDINNQASNINFSATILLLRSADRFIRLATNATALIPKVFENYFKAVYIYDIITNSCDFFFIVKDKIIKNYRNGDNSLQPYLLASRKVINVSVKVSYIFNIVFGKQIGEIFSIKDEIIKVKNLIINDELNKKEFFYSTARISYHIIFLGSLVIPEVRLAAKIMDVAYISIGLIEMYFTKKLKTD